MLDSDNQIPAPPSTPYASITQRYSAALLDYLQYFLLSCLYVRAFGEVNAVGGYTVHGALALPIYLYWLLYFPVVEGIFGCTLFKFFFDLKVIKQGDEPIGIIDALKRHLFDLVDMFLFGLIGVLVMRASAKHQRIGDQIAGTIVIQEPQVNKEYRASSSKK
jgi:uncharacterized RDD family membrane protein YckC